eukprot:6582286-Prymnesium_polylepis.1
MSIATSDNHPGSESSSARRTCSQQMCSMYMCMSKSSPGVSSVQGWSGMRTKRSRMRTYLRTVENPRSKEAQPAQSLANNLVQAREKLDWIGFGYALRTSAGFAPRADGSIAGRCMATCRAR